MAEHAPRATIGNTLKSRDARLEPRPEPRPRLAPEQHLVDAAVGEPAELLSELSDERGVPAYGATVSQRMHVHPDPSLPFVQLQRARSPRETKVPMATARAPSQLALAPNDETSLAALGEGATSGEHEIQLQHV